MNVSSNLPTTNKFVLFIHSSKWKKVGFITLNILHLKIECFVDI